MDPGPNPIAVMIVDDHPTLLWGLSQLIESEPGMRLVASASSCEQALERSEEFHPDVIVLDLDLNGRSAIEVLPGLLGGAGTRVLVLTGESDPKVLDQAVLAGARGLLCKSAPAEQVLDTIRKLHEGRLCIESDLMDRVFSALKAPTAPARQDPQAQRFASLTARERKIVETVVAGNGAPIKTLADRLFVTEHTLRNQLSTIYQKLEVANRLELYVLAARHLAGGEVAGR